MERHKKAVKNSLVISVKVIPRAREVRILREDAHSYKVKLTSAPIAGEANRQLIRLLAKEFSVAPGDMEIISGANSRRKRVRITKQ